MKKLDLALKYLNEQTPYTWQRTTMGGNCTAYETETEFGTLVIQNEQGFAPENWGLPFTIVLELDGVVMFTQQTTSGAIHSLELENCLDCGAIVAYNSAEQEWFHSDDYDLNTCFLARKSGRTRKFQTTKKEQ